MYRFLVLTVFIASTIGQSIKKTPSEDDRIIFPKDRNSSETRIYGGIEANEYDFPYQVGMYIKTGEKISFCGGSLIAQDIVLTAAHCVNGSDQVYVFYGLHNSLTYDDVTKNDEANVLKSNDFAVHEDYNPASFENDIALVFLPENVTLTERITLVTLDKENVTHVGETARVAGWGIRLNGNQNIQSGLRYIEDEIISNEKCISYFPQLDALIKESHICMSNENYKGVCSGDSGGPLVIYGEQIGIVCFGAAKCGASVPSGFTRVSSFSDWIDDEIKAYRLSGRTGTSGSPSISFGVIYYVCLIVIAGSIKQYL